MSSAPLLDTKERPGINNIVVQSLATVGKSNQMNLFSTVLVLPACLCFALFVCHFKLFWVMPVKINRSEPSSEWVVECWALSIGCMQMEGYMVVGVWRWVVVDSTCWMLNVECWLLIVKKCGCIHHVNHSDLSSKTCISIANIYIGGDYGSHNGLIKSWDTGGEYRSKFKRLYVPLSGLRNGK